MKAIAVKYLQLKHRIGRDIPKGTILEGEELEELCSLGIKVDAELNRRSRLVAIPDSVGDNKPKPSRDQVKPATPAQQMKKAAEDAARLAKTDPAMGKAAKAAAEAAAKAESEEKAKKSAEAEKEKATKSDGGKGPKGKKASDDEGSKK